MDKIYTLMEITLIPSYDPTTFINLSTLEKVVIKVSNHYKIHRKCLVSSYVSSCDMSIVTVSNNHIQYILYGMIVTIFSQLHKMNMVYNIHVYIHIIIRMTVYTHVRYHTPVHLTNTQILGY